MRAEKPTHDENLAELTRIAPNMGILLGTIAAGREGHAGAQRFDAPVVGGHTTVLDEHGIPIPIVSDPTGETALRIVERQDKARTDFGRYHNAVGLIARARLILEDLHSQWMPHAPNIIERQDTDTTDDDGCVSCARTVNSQGARRWSPVHRGDLCRWCYDWKRSTGEVPDKATLDQYHRGTGRIRKP